MSSRKNSGVRNPHLRCLESVQPDFRSPENLRKYTGAINIAGTHLSKDFQNQVWKAGLVKTETLRGEEVFSSGLNESHLSVPCFILEVSDLPDSTAQYTLVWNGSPAHTGIARGGIANREFFNPDGDAAGNTQQRQRGIWLLMSQDTSGSRCYHAAVPGCRDTSRLNVKTLCSLMMT